MRPEPLDAGDPAGIATALEERFREVYGRSPAGCSMAPGRVNLIGEHVDYNAGRCLPIALPHATYVAVAAREDDSVSVTSLQQERAWSGRLGQLGPGRVDGWPAYVAGVAWALAEQGVEVPGFDLLVDSRLPLGAGLSSSAALECAAAVALCGLAGVEVDRPLRHRLAQACVRAETEVAGAPTGGMDQAVSLLAGRDHALLLDFHDGTSRQVPWDPATAGVRLVVVDTRVSHRLTDGGYGDRRAECAEAARLLAAPSLRQVHDAPGGLEAALRLSDPRLRRRARHVLTEMDRVDLVVGHVRRGDWPGVGEAFTASHRSLRDDFEVSCPELDTTVEAALAAGALGARMTGGGFGGSAIALVPDERAQEVVRAVSSAFADRGWQTPRFLAAPASDPARQL